MLTAGCRYRGRDCNEGSQRVDRLARRRRHQALLYAEE
jgi:hypothetical protein